MALRQDELTSLCDDVDLDRDRALVERCQAGDSTAFGNLYTRYYERLLRFCMRRLNDRHEAEDAAQEAFARAWKALPRFAGERRFYPWLTVIAGNICTDMLRRRSRSTPTDDLELSARHPLGVVGEDTSEDIVLASVDGELVNRALDRLSTRHRHVLAMREGSGWTYQQIADHEGVEIGTIETLLWRARQALKREFAVVSESKEALAGFLIATGALFRRAFFRVAHRSATVQQQGAATGGLRNAVAGVAVTGAAVAAAFIAPHALSGSPSRAAVGSAGSALAAPALTLGDPVPVATGAGTTAGGGSATSSGSGSGPGASAGQPATAASSSSGGTGRSGGSGVTSSPIGGAPGGGSSSGGVAGGVAGGLDQAAGGLSGTVNGVTGGLTNTVSGVTSGLSGTVGGVTGGVSGAVGGVTNTLGLGGVLGGGGSSSSGSATGSGAGGTPAATTTTTTNPVQGVVGGVTKTVGSLLGGG